MTMPDSFVNQIDRLLDAVDGELTSRSRVIDGLLDLRLSAAGHPEILQQVDALLVDIPGLTTVTNAWWLEELGRLREAALASDPVGA